MEELDSHLNGCLVQVQLVVPELRLAGPDGTVKGGKVDGDVGYLDKHRSVELEELDFVLDGREEDEHLVELSLIGQIYKLQF